MAANCSGRQEKTFVLQYTPQITARDNNVTLHIPMHCPYRIVDHLAALYLIDDQYRTAAVYKGGKPRTHTVFFKLYRRRATPYCLRKTIIVLRKTYIDHKLIIPVRKLEQFCRLADLSRTF